MPQPTKEEYAELKRRRRAAALAAEDVMMAAESTDSIALRDAADIYSVRQAEYLEYRQEHSIKVREFEK